MHAWTRGAAARGVVSLGVAGSLLWAGSAQAQLMDRSALRGETRERAAVLPPAVLPAEANTWQPLGPEGANVIDVVDDPQDPARYWALVHNHNDLYGYRSGVRTSTDAGLTWADVPMNVGRARALSLQSGDIFVLGKSGQIQRRHSDTGIWEIVQPLQQFIFRDAVLMGPKRGPYMVVAYEPDEYGQPGGLALTWNGGDSWEVITPPDTAVLQPTALGIEGNFRAVAYQGDGDTRRLWAHRGTDDWFRVDEGLPPGRVTQLMWRSSLLFAYVEGVGLFSNDVTWDYEWKRADDGFAARGPVHAMMETWGQVFGLFVGTDTGLHLTRWQGQDWSFGIEGTRGQSIRAINGGYPNAQRITLGTYPAGILISTDAGESFEALSQGLYDRPTLSVAGNPTNPRELLTVVDDEGTTRLMRSRDIGETWDVLTGVPRHAQLVAYSPDGHVYLAARPSRGQGGATVYRQQADGRWAEGVLPGALAEGATVMRLVFSQHAAGRVWTVGADGTGDQRRASLWRSDNAGASWVQVWVADDAHTAMELMPEPGSNDQGLLMAVRRSGFLTTLTRSTDGGATWFDFNEGLEGNATRTATCVFAQDPDTAYAKIGNGPGSLFQRSLAEPGASWNRVVAGPFFFQRFICDDTNPGTFYASLSTDMGASTWQITLGDSWWEALGEHQILPPSRIDDMVLTPAGLFMASERGVLRLAQPAQAAAPADIAVSSVDGRMQRFATLQWNGGGQWVDVYRDGEVVASIRNTGQFNERLLRTGQAPQYHVCNAFSEGCSAPVTLAP